MATLKELRDRTERLKEEREEAAREVDEAARIRRPSSRYYSETPWYTSGPVYRGRYADFLKEYTESQWSGSEEAQGKVVTKYINKMTRLGVSRENAYNLLKRAWDRHRVESGSGEAIYIED